MAGEIVSFATLLQKLKFTSTEESNVRNHMQSLISADSIWVGRSAQNYPGTPVAARISISYSPSLPPFGASTGTVATDEIVTSYIRTLANTYAVVRTFRFYRAGDGLQSLVKAYYPNPTDAEDLTDAEIKQFVNFNAVTPDYIGDSNFQFPAGAGTPWHAMITYFSNREKETFQYCHGNFPPPCHGSRGRR